MLHINEVSSSNHSFPDPALEAGLTAEALKSVRDGSLSEEEYLHWDSCVSEALFEERWWKEQMEDG